MKKRRKKKYNCKRTHIPRGIEIHGKERGK